MPVLPVRRSVRGGLRGEFLGTDCAFSLPQADGTLLLIEVKEGKRRVRRRRGVARVGGARLKRMGGEGRRPGRLAFEGK